jgi:hypothetical protein
MGKPQTATTAAWPAVTGGSALSSSLRREFALSPPEPAAALEMDVAVTLPAVLEDAFDSTTTSTRGMGRALLIDAPAVHVEVRRHRRRDNRFFEDGGLR